MATLICFWVSAAFSTDQRSLMVGLAVELPILSHPIYYYIIVYSSVHPSIHHALSVDTISEPVLHPSMPSNNLSVIQMSKTPIKVLVRARPTSNFAQKNISMDENTGKINITIPKSADQGLVNHQQESWGFEFNKVLVNASQEVVFNLVAKDILISALEGYSGCILCYGQTGAGKTFSMTGARNDYKYRGIIPRVVSSVFQEIGSRYEHQIKVYVSYLELYNETLFDLISTSPENEGLSIQEDNKGYVFAKGQTMTKCENEEQALQALFSGESHRTISQHKLNRNSSRSHTIFTIHLQIRSKVESSEKVIMSKINLVDLAGSERTKKTGSEGKTLIEAQFINKSLSFLEQLVIALSEKKRDHIPYRQNKLTYLLKDSIGGNSKTYMIANIWPEENHLEETISTLKFASRMMKVSNETSIEMNLDPSLLIKKYEKEVKELKQELAMHDTLTNRGRVTYEPYNAEQQYEQQKVAKDFLDGKIDNIQIDSLRQVRELFVQFKGLYRNLAKNVTSGQLAPQKDEDTERGKTKEAAKTGAVGVEENKFGFGVGKASKDSKPTQNISNLVNIPKDQFHEDQQPQKEEKPSKVENKIVNINKNEAYQQFKSTSGKEINDSILKNNQELKQKREDIKRRTEEAQSMKSEIEETGQKLNEKEESKTPEEINQGIIDEEEFGLLKKKKELKRQYKQELEKIKTLRSSLIEIDSNITSLKTSLLQKFEQWFFKRYGIYISDLENPLINKKEDDEGEEVHSSQVREEEVDEDAMAYIKAKKKVSEIQRAIKNKY